MKGVNRTGLLLDKLFERHDTGMGHPETAGRVKAVAEKLEAEGLVEKCQRLNFRQATDEEILLCHTPDYLKLVKKEIDGQSSGQLSTGDTAFGAQSLDVAEKAVGGVLTAVDAVVNGEVSNAFAVVRPPGHHANADTGQGKGVGATINHPLPAGVGMREVEEAFKKSLLPKMKKFKPEMILLSAGFDSRIGDPLGQFRLSDEDFVELTNLLLELAAEYCEGRLVSVLEGGYSLSGLASAAAAHLGALINSK